jgi:hypothetical protein
MEQMDTRAIVDPQVEIGSRFDEIAKSLRPEADFEAPVVVGIRVADLVVEDQIPIERANHEIRERASGLGFFDHAEYPEIIATAASTRHQLPFSLGWFATQR